MDSFIYSFYLGCKINRAGVDKDKASDCVNRGLGTEPFLFYVVWNGAEDSGGVSVTELRAGDRAVLGSRCVEWSRSLRVCE